MDELYSLENARKFKWSSVSGDLNPERVAHLDRYLVGKRVLDAGCGGGAFVEHLAEKGLDVTGVDKYAQFLDLAREKGRLGTYVQGDLTALEFADKSFDCTYCFDVLEHVDDRLAIAELARVTRRRLILAVPREDQEMPRYNVTFLHYLDRTHLRTYTEESLRALAEKTRPSRVSILPELLVPLPHMLREVVRFAPGGRLGQLRTRVLRSLYEKLLNQALFTEIPTGLVAVIDL